MREVYIYKDFYSNIKFSDKNNTQYDKNDNILDLVNFKSKDLFKAIKEFHKAADEYIDFCKEVNKPIGLKES